MSENPFGPPNGPSSGVTPEEREEWAKAAALKKRTKGRLTRKEMIQLRDMAIDRKRNYDNHEYPTLIHPVEILDILEPYFEKETE